MCTHRPSRGVGFFQIGPLLLTREQALKLDGENMCLQSTADEQVGSVGYSMMPMPTRSIGWDRCLRKNSASIQAGFRRHVRGTSMGARAVFTFRAAMHER